MSSKDDLGQTQNAIPYDSEEFVALQGTLKRLIESDNTLYRKARAGETYDLPKGFGGPEVAKLVDEVIAAEAAMGIARINAKYHIKYRAAGRAKHSLAVQFGHALEGTDYETATRQKQLAALEAKEDARDATIKDLIKKTVDKALREPAHRQSLVHIAIMRGIITHNHPVMRVIRAGFQLEGEAQRALLKLYGVPMLTNEELKEIAQMAEEMEINELDIYFGMTEISFFDQFVEGAGTGAGKAGEMSSSFVKGTGLFKIQEKSKSKPKHCTAAWVRDNLGLRSFPLGHFLIGRSAAEIEGALHEFLVKMPMVKRSDGKKNEYGIVLASLVSSVAQGARHRKRVKECGVVYSVYCTVLTKAVSNDAVIPNKATATTAPSGLHRFAPTSPVDVKALPAVYQVPTRFQGRSAKPPVKTLKNHFLVKKK